MSTHYPWRFLSGTSLPVTLYPFDSTSGFLHSFVYLSFSQRLYFSVIFHFPILTSPKDKAEYNSQNSSPITALRQASIVTLKDNHTFPGVFSLWLCQATELAFHFWLHIIIHQQLYLFRSSLLTGFLLPRSSHQIFKNWDKLFILQ